MDVPAAATGKSRADLLGRVAVTVCVPLALYVASWIPVPWVPAAALASSYGTDSSLSVLTLGITPILSGFMLVEWASLLIPSWRRLRHGGFAERGKLIAWALRATIALALLQGFMIASSLSGMRPTAHGSIVSGTYAAPAIAATLTAGTVVVLLGAALVNRFGLGNGFAVILGASFLRTLAEPMTRLAQQGRDWWQGDAVPSPAPPLVLLAAVVVATVLALRRRTSLPVPASGVVPFSIATTLVMFAATVLTFWPSRQAFAHTLAPGSSSYTFAGIGFILVLTPFLAIAFNPPSRVAAVRAACARGSLTPIVADSGEAIRTSMLFVLGVVAAEIAADRLGFSLSGTVPVVLTALGLDLAADWKARRDESELVALVPVHRPYAVPPFLSALETAGVRAHASMLRFRTMLQFFGPYVPIVIYVPRAQLDVAERVTRETLLGEASGAG